MSAVTANSFQLLVTVKPVQHIVSSGIVPALFSPHVALSSNQQSEVPDPSALTAHQIQKTINKVHKE